MKTAKTIAMLGLMTGLMAGSALATDVPAGVHSTSETWTKANSPYQLKGQVYFTNGATLTIEAGTRIVNDPDDLGSLAICRGAKIYVLGTASQPVVFTADDPFAIPTPLGESNPNRLGTQLWGNITLMGEALISASNTNALNNPIGSYQETAGPVVFNTKTPTGLNKSTMEGFGGASGNSNIIYGGANDNDDSGTIAYVSLRYGGKTTAQLNSELNGLSIGGVGRNTDIHHVDIWNNIDDGIEIWGGTVNFKYVNIWNIGDDSFDIDQGWRGKAQFGLIVQGYGKTSGTQGSGVGDNVFEHDGAEAADAQPVTTATIYNFTAIGQPGSTGGDAATAWRDGARVQYRNCVFMDIGDRIVFEEFSESTTTSWGYGMGGTLTLAQCFSTAYTATSTVNPGTDPATFDDPGVLYQAQSAGNAAIGQGFLAEMTDCVFYNNTNANAYTNANTFGVTVGGASNPAKANVVAATSPIVALTRGTPVVPGTNLLMALVTQLDPRAANDAVTSISAAPADGFFTPAQYRGGFSDDNNWALGWTAADEYGIFTSPANPAGPKTTLVAFGLNFQTEVGKSYVIESSTDGVNWVAITTVSGDGGLKVVSSYTTLEASKLYRVSVQ